MLAAQTGASSDASSKQAEPSNAPAPSNPTRAAAPAASPTPQPPAPQPPARKQHDLAPHLATLQRALGAKLGQLDEADLKDELQKYLDYGVPPEQAVKTILRHHGVGYTPAGGAPAGAVAGAGAPLTLGPGPVPLAQLPANVGAATILVRITAMDKKTVSARGEQKEVVVGFLADASGSRQYTSWRPLEGLAVGDVIEANGVYTKEFRGEVQVNFGDRCRIQKRDDSLVPRGAASLAAGMPGGAGGGGSGGTGFAAAPLADYAVKDLAEGQRGVRVTGRILSVAPRQVVVQGTPKTVWSGTFADASGKVEFTSWHDHQLAEGQAVTIAGAYVRTFRNLPQLTFDQQASVTPAPTGAVPEAAVLAVSPPTLLGDLVERGGGNDLTVVATLLEVRPGSGLVLRCPAPDATKNATCGRVVTGNQCRLHGKVEGTPDLRLKGILDDGTGAVSFVAGREATESLLGKTLAQCQEEARNAMRIEVIQEQLHERLAGRGFTVRGNALKDDYGLMLLARSVEPRVTDVQAEAKALLGALPAQFGAGAAGAGLAGADGVAAGAM